MPAEIIRSVVIDDETIAADGTKNWDLPVGPISFITLTIKALNVTDEATIPNLLDMVTKVEVLHRGTSIYSLSSRDLHALNCVLSGKLPLALNLVAADNAVRAITLLIPFGRDLFNPNECFPDTKRGELVLSLTMDYETTEADGLIILAEATELVNARPARHLKVTTLTYTVNTLGDNDIPLPIQAEQAGILLFSTTVPTTTTWANTIDEVKLLRDNKEFMISASKWEALQDSIGYRLGHQPGYIAASGDPELAHYGFIDFTYKNQDSHLVDTRGMSSWVLRIVSESTTVLRALPLELLPAST